MSGRDEAVTADTLLRGRVRLFQPKRGARMSLDPVLLAGFLAAPYGRFLDVGCGTGALSFLLLARDPSACGVGVELQPRLADLAARGRDANGWAARFEVVPADVRTAEVDTAAFDLVATNPPYRLPGSSQPSPNRERALAHHEIALTLRDWIRVSARAVRPRGRVAAILPAVRADQLLGALRAEGLHPVRVRFAHPRDAEPPGRVLVEARPGAGPCETEPPLIVHGPGGGFSTEVRGMLGETD
jgi:tRNA1(Val) A37 N6-methylase TrmN6